MNRESDVAWVRYWIIKKFGEPVIFRRSPAAAAEDPAGRVGWVALRLPSKQSAPLGVPCPRVTEPRAWVGRRLCEFQRVERWGQVGLCQVAGAGRSQVLGRVMHVTDRWSGGRPGALSHLGSPGRIPGPDLCPDTPTRGP